MAVAVGVLVVGVVPVFVELPPQAARSTSVLSATRQNKTGLSCFLAVEIPKVIDLFKSIFFLLSERYYTCSHSDEKDVTTSFSSECEQVYYFYCDHILHIRDKVTSITYTWVC